MKLIPVEAVPAGVKRHNLQELIGEFVRGDAKVVRIEFGEDDYKNPQSCSSCLASAVRRSRHPVAVIRRGDQVFLSKL